MKNKWIIFIYFIINKSYQKLLRDKKFMQKIYQFIFGFKKIF
jgi:hypothetical protein